MYLKLSSLVAHVQPPSHRDYVTVTLALTLIPDAVRTRNG